jgi:hypothetical protein
MKRVLPIVSISTTLVILTLPTFHCIWHFLREFVSLAREHAGLISRFRAKARPGPG